MHFWFHPPWHWVCKQATSSSWARLRSKSFRVKFLRNIREMERGWWWVDVLVVLAPWLLETVQRRVGEVLGEAGVGLALLGHLNSLMLGRHGPHLFAVHLQLIQMSHGCNVRESLPISTGLLISQTKFVFLPSWAWWGSAIWMSAVSFLLNSIFTRCTSP